MTPCLPRPDSLIPVGCPWLLAPRRYSSLFEPRHEQIPEDSSAFSARPKSGCVSWGKCVRCDAIMAALSIHGGPLKHPVSPSTIVMTSLVFAFLGLVQLSLAQANADLSKPATGVVIVLGERGPTAEDAGIRAHSNVKLFVPVGTGQPSVNPPGPPLGAETPASLACIYRLVSEPSNVLPGCQIADSNLVNPSGGSSYIFIVEPYDDPTAASDLAAFAAYYNMPTPKFGTVYATGSKPALAPPNWLLEEATSVEWAYAMAPNATIILVEAKDALLLDMMKAMDVARSYFTQLQLCSIYYCPPTYQGEISISWASAEWSGETSYDIHFMPPTVCQSIFCIQNANPMVIFAASGDIAEASQEYFGPALRRGSWPLGAQRSIVMATDSLPERPPGTVPQTVAAAAPANMNQSRPGNFH